MELLICSDIHYASDAEKARRDYEVRSIDSAWQRFLVRRYRRHVWLRDPFAHNELLDRVLDHPGSPDVVVANGDFSCDSAFVGVSDPAARESASLCLARLRERFGTRFSPVFGDHELGKVSLCGGRGGLRFESLRVAEESLGLQRCWTQRFGRYVLLAITSTLAAMPVYEAEALPEERKLWREQARQHVGVIASAFDSLRDSDRLLLFCHDPTALPFLWEIPGVQRRASQIERTIIGHLHSRAVLWPSRLLAGLPRIDRAGPTVRRISSALARSKTWEPFRLLLCPSLAGIELFKRGGYYTATLDPDAKSPARFQLHTIRR